MPEIIVLFYMLDFQDTKLLNVLFGDKIRKFFSFSSSTFSNINSLERYCRKFNFPVFDVSRLFVDSVLTFSSSILSDTNALLKCFSVYSIESEFQGALSIAVKNSSYLFSKGGKTLLEFLEKLQAIKSVNPGFDGTIALRVVLQETLPKLVTHQKIKDLWNDDRVGCGCISFFADKKSESETDAYKKLLAVNKQCVQGDYTAYKASAERVKILFELVIANKGNDFLNAVKSNFCEHFFEQLNPLLQ